MADEKCAKCPQAATFYKTDKGKMFYECGEHAGFDWHLISALGGGTQEIAKAAAAVQKGLMGDHEALTPPARSAR